MNGWMNRQNLYRTVSRTNCKTKIKLVKIQSNICPQNDCHTTTITISATICSHKDAPHRFMLRISCPYSVCCCALLACKMSFASLDFNWIFWDFLRFSVLIFVWTKNGKCCFRRCFCFFASLCQCCVFLLFLLFRVAGWMDFSPSPAGLLLRIDMMPHRRGG